MPISPSFFEDSQTQDNPPDEPKLEYNGDYTLDTFKKWYDQDRSHSRDWRQEAREDYDFVAGQQWNQEDASYLKQYLRPIITFNRIDPVVYSVAGLEINNRQEISYFPRHVGDAAMDELLSGAAKWFRDECNAEDEESDAFVDLIICGMGVTETGVKYDEDPEGQGTVERVDPMEMYWDSTSKKKNIEDARRLFRVRDVSALAAEEMFPDTPLADLHASWAEDTAGMAQSPHDAQQAPFYRHDQSGLIDKNTTLIRLVELQFWQHETAWLILDPFTGQRIVLSDDEYKVFSQRAMMLGLPLKAVKQKRKCYWKAFLGAKVLDIMKGPEEGGFTYKCMTGKRDRNKGTWYGLVRAMIDPQKWANKWLSQGLHVMNTNSSGGIVAEAGTFEDIQEVEDNWADPSYIPIVRKGMMDKWKEKPKAEMPQGIQGLMEYAVSSIRDVSGVNLELLGASDRNQPGILEHQRKQSAMTILAGFFDSLRRYRKEQGRLLLFYITKYLSDGRLIRIGGQDKARYVPLIHNPSVTKYDVIVDDTPTSVNIKEQTWAAITQMMPILSRLQIPPEMWMTLLKYSPIPDSLVTELTQIIQKTPPQQHQDPAMMAAQAKMQAVQAKGQLDQQKMQGDTQMQQARMQADMQMEQQKINLESQARQQEIAIQAQTDTQQMKMEQDARIREMILEYALKDREQSRKEGETSLNHLIDKQKLQHTMHIKGQELQLKKDMAQANNRNEQ